MNKYGRLVVLLFVLGVIRAYGMEYSPSEDDEKEEPKIVAALQKIPQTLQKIPANFKVLKKKLKKNKFQVSLSLEPPQYACSDNMSFAGDNLYTMLKMLAKEVEVDFVRQIKGLNAAQLQHFSYDVRSLFSQVYLYFKSYNTSQIKNALWQMIDSLDNETQEVLDAYMQQIEGMPILLTHSGILPEDIRKLICSYCVQDPWLEAFSRIKNINESSVKKIFNPIHKIIPTSLTIIDFKNGWYHIKANHNSHKKSFFHEEIEDFIEEPKISHFQYYYDYHLLGSGLFVIRDYQHHKLMIYAVSSNQDGIKITLKSEQMHNALPHSIHDNGIAFFCDKSGNPTFSFYDIEHNALVWQYSLSEKIEKFTNVECIIDDKKEWAFIAAFTSKELQHIKVWVLNLKKQELYDTFLITQDKDGDEVSELLCSWSFTSPEVILRIKSKSFLTEPTNILYVYDIPSKKIIYTLSSGNITAACLYHNLLVFFESKEEEVSRRFTYQHFKVLSTDSAAIALSIPLKVLLGFPLPSGAHPEFFARYNNEVSILIRKALNQEELDIREITWLSLENFLNSLRFTLHIEPKDYALLRQIATTTHDYKNNQLVPKNTRYFLSPLQHKRLEAFIAKQHNLSESIVDALRALIQDLILFPENPMSFEYSG